MARGRKKGGISVNEINDRDKIVEMIINQINSLNKKMKKFNEKSLEEPLTYINTVLTNDMVNRNGITFSKSKKFYYNKNTVLLKKTLAALIKVNNHEYYGTERKYQKEVTKSFLGLKTYVDEYLRKKGYNENFIFEVTNDKNFYVALYDAFGNKEEYGSDKVIEKIALQYENTGLTEKEKDKILSNIEYSKNVIERLKEERQAIEETKRNMKLR